LGGAKSNEKDIVLITAAAACWSQNNAEQLGGNQAKQNP
jgi:hypothetical protein